LGTVKASADGVNSRLGNAAYGDAPIVYYLTFLKAWVVVLVTILPRRATVLLNHDTSL
jgi:hypothetical protein